jgi:hypothetical protein
MPEYPVSQQARQAHAADNLIWQREFKLEEAA